MTVVSSLLLTLLYLCCSDAMVIGQAVTALLALWYLLRMKLIHPAPSDYRPSAAVCGQTLLLGISSLLSQISLVAAMAAINNMLRK